MVINKSVEFDKTLDNVIEQLNSQGEEVVT